MAVSKRLRFEILRRDGHMCRYCGRTAIFAVERDEAMAEQDRWFDYWCSYVHDDGSTVALPSDWRITIEQFLSNHLSMADLFELTERALTVRSVHRDNRWRYFCGCCWGRIRDLQERAKSNIASEDGTENAQ